MKTGAKKTILLVDDEPDLREIMRDELEADYTIHEAADGVDGFEKALRLKPDLIISDINMPRMSGLDFLAKLRDEGFKTPVIIVTGFADTEKNRRAWELGAFDFLDKPIHMDKLHSLAKMALTFGGRAAPDTEGASENAVASLNLQISQVQLAKLLEFCKRNEKSAAQVLEDLIKKHVA